MECETKDFNCVELSQKVRDHKRQRRDQAVAMNSEDATISGDTTSRQRFCGASRIGTEYPVTPQALPRHSPGTPRALPGHPKAKKNKESNSFPMQLLTLGIICE